MMLFERIKQLANEQKMSIRQLEEKLGYGNGTINRWKKTNPGINKLEKVADYFNVSTDYLLGRNVNKNNLTPEKLFNHIIFIIQAKDLTLSQINEKAGLDNNEIYKWQIKFPSIEDLNNVEKILKVSVEDLLDYKLRNAVVHCILGKNSEYPMMAKYLMN